MQHKTLYIILGCILFALIFRMCMFERRYYVSENRCVIINRITNNAYYKLAINMDEIEFQKMVKRAEKRAKNANNDNSSSKEIDFSKYDLEIEPDFGVH